jgi:plasmid stabilization system protein ParE
MRCLPDCAPGSASRRLGEHAAPASPLAARCGGPGGHGRYIARDNPERAATFVEELEAKCRAVAAAPDICPARLDVSPGLRMAVHSRYLVLFRELPGKADLPNVFPNEFSEKFIVSEGPYYSSSLYDEAPPRRSAALQNIGKRGWLV